MSFYYGKSKQLENAIGLSGVNIDFFDRLVAIIFW